jgi:hypothetical protein
MIMASIRRIRMIRVPFNYDHGRARVSVVRQAGVYPVGHGKGEIDPDIAAAALAEGAAEEFDPAPAKKAPARRSTAKASPANVKADAADTGKSADMDREGLAGDGGTADQSAMDDAG